MLRSHAGWRAPVPPADVYRALRTWLCADPSGGLRRRQEASCSVAVCVCVLHVHTGHGLTQEGNLTRFSGSEISGAK